MASLVQVVPVARPPSSLYTIEGSGQLPRIDATRTIKSVLLSPQGLRKCNALLHRFGRVLTLTNGIASFLANAVGFYPAPVGRWIALLVTPLTLPPIVAVFLGLRFDMIILLLGTFDFWYQGITSIMCPILFAFYTRDVRGAGAIGTIPMLLVVLLADANYRAARFFMVTSVFAAALCIADALLMMLGGVDDAPSLELLRVYGHAVTAQAVMAHGFVVTAILHLHNAYVRRQFAAPVASTSALSTTVRCVLYKSRLRWCRFHGASSRRILPRELTARSLDNPHLQLRCHGLLQVIDARHTFLPSCRTSVSILRRVELIFSGCIGFGAIVAAMVAVAIGYDGHSLVLHVFGGLSLVLTTRVWLYFVCCIHQLDMLRLIHTSFDFLFVFVQLFLAQLCLCDLCGWDARALVVAASLLWVHWALTVDAIPPLAREQLRLSTHRVALVIEVAYLVGIVLFAFDLLVWESQRFQDRQLMTRSSSDVAKWSVGSFFLNRLGTLVPWLCRSLWRLVAYDTDELVVLRGAVEYEMPLTKHKRSVRPSPDASSQISS